MEKNYRNFINKYKDQITNIPTIDGLASFYLEKMNEINFSNTDEVYDYLSDVRKLNDYEQSFDIWLPSLNDIRERLEYSGIEFIDAYKDRAFIGFLNPNYELKYPRGNESKKDLGNQLKLYVSAKLDNVSKLALKLAKKIDLRIREGALSDKDDTLEITQFKISKDLHRNDTVTIYTDYSCAEQIIQDLMEIKEENPELFEVESRPNPFAMQINGFISYVDIDHNSSFPKLLSRIFSEVERSRSTILNIPPDERLSLVKVYVLNAIIGEFYLNKQTILANPQNMASSRIEDGTLIKNLSAEERKQYVSSLNQIQEELIKDLDQENGMQ